MKFASIALLILTLVSGCSKSSNDSAIKDVFFHALKSEPSDLHPIRATEIVSKAIVNQSIHYASNIVETLTALDLETYEPVPNLAKKWEISPDGKTFTFFLRKDVKFHDGSLMTSADVDFSFKAMFDDLFEAYALRSFYKNFIKSKIIDEYTISFTAKDSYYLNLDVIGGLPVLPKAFYSKQTKENRLSKTVMGSGPYKFEKWNKGKSLTVSAFDGWWGRRDSVKKDGYKFKKIVFKFIKESTLRIAMLERGKLDYDMDVRAEDLSKNMTKSPWGKSVFGVKAVNKLPKNLLFIGLNNKSVVFTDAKVRKAMSHLVNKEFLNEKFYYGLNELATGPFRLGSDYSNPNTKPLKFDPEKAKKLLSEAGWEDTDKNGVLDKVIDGKKTNFTFNVLNSSKDTEKVITVIKEDMKKAGVEMVIETIDWNAFVKALNERKFESVIMRWGGGPVNPDPTQIWHSKSAAAKGSNFVNYSNPKVDKLIESAVNILDKKKRIDEFHKIHQLIAEDAPYIFLFEPKYSMYAVSKRVQRFKDTYNYSTGPRYWSLPE